VSAVEETTAASLRERATLWPKGNHFEDFTVGQRFEHHWGRTLLEGDNTLFTLMTLHYNPVYFNAEAARAEGNPDLVVNPMLVFLTVFGLSVEDLSEAGGAFLGVDELAFHKTLAAGDTVTATSEVTALRESGSRPDAGIVTWHTEGFDQRGDRVIDFLRTNLINRRGART
jgi:itaconyl-CoA hydratase